MYGVYKWALPVVYKRLCPAVCEKSSIFIYIKFSSELLPKVLRAATLVSGPTAAWRTAGFMDEETATLRRGQATDNDLYKTFWVVAIHVVLFISRVKSSAGIIKT